MLVCCREQGVHGSIILKWILKKYGVRVWTGFIWIRAGECGLLSGLRRRVILNVVISASDERIQMTEAIHSSETSVTTYITTIHGNEPSGLIKAEN
jgi:hypothetical protein